VSQHDASREPLPSEWNRFLKVISARIAISWIGAMAAASAGISLVAFDPVLSSYEVFATGSCAALLGTIASIRASRSKKVDVVALCGIVVALASLSRAWVLIAQLSVVS